MEKTKQKNKIILCCIIYMISALIFILVRIGSKNGVFSFLGEYRGLIINILNQLLFIGGVPLLFYTLFESKNIKKTFSDFKFKKIPRNLVGSSIYLGVVLFGFIIIISSIWQGVIGLTDYKSPLFSLSFASASNPWAVFGINFVVACLLPAFCEEVLLRGCVLNGLEKFGRKKAIIFCGLLFGFLHLNIYQLPYTIIMGMFFALVVLMTGSVWPAIIMHFTSNFCSVFAEFIGDLNLFNGQLNSFVNSLFSGSVFSVFLNIVLLSMILMYLFIILFARFVKYSRSKSLYDKMQSILKQSSLKEGDKIEIDEKTGEALIKMRAMVENEVMSQMMNTKNAFDFILPPNENDKYKPTKVEKFFIIASLCLTGVALLVGFVGGIFLV